MVRGGCAIIGLRCGIDNDLGGDDHDDLGDHGLMKRLVRGGCVTTGLRYSVEYDQMMIDGQDYNHDDTEHWRGHGQRR